LTSGIRVGIHYGTDDPVEVQRAVWRAADEAGFDAIWNADHLVTSNAPSVPILDAWTTLAAMAEATSRIRLGVLVTGNLYRHPALLAKIATTVDHLSQGRLEVGLGTAWNEPEFTTMGMEFADAPERAGRLDEACRVLKLLWTSERANFQGRYYRLTDAVMEPKPLQQPHPPLLIGGRGPKVTLRAAARYGDAWNSSGNRGYDVVVEASQILDEHCVRIGRDPKTIRRSVILAWPNADQGFALAERYVRAGFSEFMIGVGSEDRHGDRRDDPVRGIETLARTCLEPLRALGGASVRSAPKSAHPVRADT
jgi:F420-dependent oxidoreductase-like protein